MGLALGIYVHRSIGIPFVRSYTEWSIGIYTGHSPLHLTDSGHATLGGAPRNPVLTARSVTDVPAFFVADPFMVKEGDRWYMFFEVLNAQTRQGDIGLATSMNALEWTYDRIVLDEPFHLSYPYVFKWEESHFMIPEASTRGIRLYRATDFPGRWAFVKTLLEGTFVDPSIFRFSERWWLFACENCHDYPTLRLYYADELLGPWSEHPQSPIAEGNPYKARPGGRVIVFDGRIVRYAQDGVPYYGKQVRAFEIMELTTTRYKEREAIGGPILQGRGVGWNAKGMHHIDPHRINESQWIAVVDGQRWARTVRVRPRVWRPNDFVRVFASSRSVVPN